MAAIEANALGTKWHAGVVERTYIRPAATAGCDLS
jgi:hypothetical protein